MRPRRLGVAIFLVGWAAACLAEADTKMTGPDGGMKYRRQLAIVVGVNYQGRDALPDSVLPLKNAEADAEAVANALSKYYGFRSEGADKNLFLLKGPQATREAIVRLFGKFLLKNHDEVTADDSVLFFFAGHGSREKHKNLNEMLIYPYDVQGLENGVGVDDSTCISIGGMLFDLDICEARHKLLLLDSCHSGEIFSTRGVGERSGSELVPSLFNAKVTQALTAAAADQLAQDGGGTHSPFTEALLEALEGKTLKGRVFGASALFSVVPARVKELNQQRRTPQSQTPRGGPLSGDGEYYFFRTTAPAETAPAGIDPRRLTLQTLPGLTGRWWFDEIPWFAPSLRTEPTLLELLPLSVTAFKPSAENMPEPAFSLEECDVQRVVSRLRERAVRSINGKPSTERLALGALLQFSSQVDLGDDQISHLLKLFENHPDPHLKAVIHHRLNREDASDLYKAALASYEQTAARTRGGSGADPADASGLLRLCWSDYGRFLLDMGYTLEARSAFRNALDFDNGTKPPTLFVVDCLLQRARAEAAVGEWTAAEESLKSAWRLAEEELPPDHPIVAAIHDRLAWTSVDRWKLDDAQRHFQSAMDIRRCESQPDLQTRIAILHNLHGLAMVERFRGRNLAARAGYERLAKEARELSSLCSSRTDSELVYGRSVNSLERLADCCLFATPPDPLEAYETFEQALGLCRRLSPQTASLTRARLLCKTAMALALLDKPQQALVMLDDVKRQTYPLLIGNQSQEADLHWRLAEAIAKLQMDPTTGRAAVRAAANAISAGRGLSARRQDWEAALFVLDVLVRSYGSEITGETLDDADELLSLAGGEFLNRSNLLYLRPYFNTALRVKLAKPDSLGLRNLANSLLRAQSGDSTRMLPRDRSAVVFFLDKQDGFVVFVPSRTDQGVVQSITLPTGFGRDDLKSAVLPRELESRLQKTEKPAIIFWADLGLDPCLTNQEFPMSEAARWQLSVDNSPQ